VYWVDRSEVNTQHSTCISYYLINNNKRADRHKLCSLNFPANSLTIYPWIGPLSSLPMQCLPFCTLFCGDQPKTANTFTFSMHVDANVYKKRTRDSWLCKQKAHAQQLTLCVTDEVITILGRNPGSSWADFLSKGIKSSVRRKCPRWLVPNCISNPSSVRQFGHIMTPALLTK
jgi:hypothetical protein